MGRSSRFVVVPGVCQRSYIDSASYSRSRPHFPIRSFPDGCYFSAHGSPVPNTYADYHPCSSLCECSQSDTIPCSYPNGDNSPNTHCEAHGNPYAYTGGSGSHDYANTASRALPDSSRANLGANPSAYPRGNSNSPFSLA